MSSVDAFEIVVIVVAVASAVIAIVYAAKAGSAYKQVGRLGDFWIDTEKDGDSTSDRDLVREDVEQMLAAIEAARNARSHRTDF
jgi:hypothetical protein